ncbi:hypothetical protein NDU88_002270 [Pleurodeles waltl]|uniref:Uncharacterized protein n=1 Tax=Pleurodeles waltl TaxID=8319 RepID=A0AAV7LID2_PLEWA|nr:hypothetical protein NDU88_002270 [Pleurodeles waltl]
MTSQDVSNSVAYKKERRERRLGVLVGLTWSGGYSRLSGSQVALKPTRRPRRQSQHSGSRHLTGAGWRFPPFATGTEPQVQKKVPFPWLGGPSPGEDEVLSAYPGGVVRETLGHRRGGCLLAALRAGAGSWRCPGAGGRVGPAALPVMQAGRSGSEAGNAGRVLRLPAGEAGRVCRLVPGSGAVEGRGSPRELSVEGGLRSEARSRHDPGDAAGCGCCQCLLGAQGASAACSPRRW